MRKQCKRKIRPLAKLLAPSQHNDLMMGPLMHLELICLGTGTREHARSVAGLLNIGTALAYLAKRKVLYTNLQGCLTILQAAVLRSEPLVITEDDQARLRYVCTELEGYMSLQHKSKLISALEFIEHALKTGEGAEVIAWPSDPEEVVGNGEEKV